MIRSLRSLYSRGALIATISYAVLIATLAIWTWRGGDAESRSVGLGILGLPWVLGLSFFSKAGWFLYGLAVALNVATV